MRDIPKWFDAATHSDVLAPGWTNGPRTGVSETSFEELLSDDVLQNFGDDLQNGSLHGLRTAGFDESVLMHGPPGAGKSTEALGRLAAYCAFNDVDPRDVTIVTFRKELAKDIIGRLKAWGIFELLGDGDDSDPWKWMGTAHAVAARTSGFFDQFPDDEDGGESEYAGMVSRDTKTAFCAEYGIEFASDVPWRDSEWDVFHDLYVRCKQNLVDAGEWTHVSESDLTGSINEVTVTYRGLQDFRDVWGDTADFHGVVEAWESWKAEHDVYDYWEQLEAALATHLHGSEYLITDEIHDAYPLMSLVFERWIDLAEVAVVAGDPDQVCNSFSGSDPAIFNDLPNRVETELPIVRLPKSHRVPAEHFAAAAAKLDEHHHPPELETAGYGNLYRHDAAGTMTHRDDGWLPLHPEDPGSPLRLYEMYGPDMIQMARTQRLVDAIAACLDDGGVIYRSQDNVAGNWSRRLAVMRALKLIQPIRPSGSQAAIDDDDAFGRDGDSDGQMKNGVAPEESRTMLSPRETRALIEHTDERYFEDSRAHALAEIKEIKRDNDRQGVQMTDLDTWMVGTWWAAYGQGRDSIENLVYINAYHGFTGNRDRDVAAMKKAWDRYAASFPDDLSDVGLKLWTIHSAKGDEAEHGVVFDGVTGRIRDSVREHPDQAANESRTWYVGLTRAKKGLHIVRDWCDEIVDNYDVLPDDLERNAAHTARQRREITTDGTIGGDSA